MDNSLNRLPLELPTAFNEPYYLPPLERTRNVLPEHFNRGITILPGNQTNERTRVDLPALDKEYEMQFGVIPAPFKDTIRQIHYGISPRFSNGLVILTNSGGDIHHIVKRSYVKQSSSVARELLPFNGAVRQTFDILTDIEHRGKNIVRRYGGQGNMLMNLILLDHSFHHQFIERKPYDHPLDIRFDNETHVVTVPELLMSFNIFNLRLRFNLLSRIVNKGLENCRQKLATTAGKELEAQKAHYYAWESMMLELPRIPIIAQEIQEDHPILFAIWQSALGPAFFRQFPESFIEQ